MLLYKSFEFKVSFKTFWSGRTLTNKQQCSPEDSKLPGGIRSAKAGDTGKAAEDNSEEKELKKRIKEEDLKGSVSWSG